MLVPKLIAEFSELDAWIPAWDLLAVEAGLPLMAPACALAWWRHLASARAELRAIAIREGDETIGFAPFYADVGAHWMRQDWRLPGIELAAGLAPLARAGREREVAGAIATAVAGARDRPDLVALEGMPATASWDTDLKAGWPGRVAPLTIGYLTRDCPVVSLREESFEAWLAGKSSNFRGQMRRLRRRFGEAGGAMRLSSSETLTADVAAFVRLHAGRWEGRGESRLVSYGERLGAMLEDLGRELLEQGRFRLWIGEVAGETISAQLFLAAGERSLYVNGGWDERFAKLKPSLLAILAAIEQGFEHGERCLDLGVGPQDYKLRFADANAPVGWSVLVPAGARMPLALPHTAWALGGTALRSTIKERVAPERLERYRALRARLRRETRHGAQPPAPGAGAQTGSG
ncbi:MAG TPA: GNAT family N-acetyltransferase [Solirubrobacteraceae bacterium]|nr:GNAT family N-acetyltransferase [Solirubrobacteraceae bacterium]